MSSVIQPIAIDDAIPSQKMEFIFLVDRSGSMEGVAITFVSEALKLFLKSLPLGCQFNFVGFGDSYKALFETSRSYTESSVKEASVWISNLKADMGGSLTTG